ncbi:hypothetical protein ABIA38_001460 [Embleya sp. AB8]
MIPDRQDGGAYIGPSGDPHRPNRITLLGRPLVDVTHDELVALQHEIRAYLLYPIPGPPSRRLSNLGG